ncbi:phage tail protein [Pseudomonas sp. Marseille-P9899]|uniref:phage tail protein n=1 Tax=Pseudomonas sp. Marseille-P9899 TaxID=2730401 RepID=UPI00273D940C|nr:phage tail protein [Pseudomonas sp. Marseille-P9899]
MTDQNSQFFAILTAVGEAKQANANALGVPWTFAQMGVGDANLTDPIPSRSQTRLINERRRAPLNQVKIDPNNASIIIAEQVIPPDAGGWWIREIGLYDTDGDLVAVANCAPSFKPLLSQGTGKTQVVRLNIIVTSTANVQLKIDPAVVLATREFVETRIAEELDKLDGKNSVRAATVAAITLSGLKTIDGVALQLGDRVLVKDQLLGKDNGIYVVAAAAWLRARDADGNADVTPGLTVTVEQGELQADTLWKLVTDAPLLLGVTALQFRNITAGYNGTSPRDISGAISPAEAGKMIYYYGQRADQTLTLPAAASLPLGGTINVQNVSSAPVTIAKVGTDTLQIGGEGGRIDSLVLYPGSELEFTCASGYEWFAQGTGALHRMNGLPTLPVGTSNGQLATAGFVQQELAAVRGTGVPLMDGVATPGVSAKTAREDHRHPTDVTRAPLESPAFTGWPTANTPGVGVNNAQIATTAFVSAAVAALVNAAPGALDTLNELAIALGNDPNFAATMNYYLSLKAPLASPVFTGAPSAPLAATGQSTGQLATTGFVQQELAAGRGSSAPLMDGVAAPGVSAKTAREDHRHPTDVTRAPLESPAFSGVPTAPTPALAVNNSQVATTAFVSAAVAALVNAAPGALDTLNELAAALGNDPNFAATMNYYLSLKAPLASPVFSGAPTGPTAALFDDSKILANTEFVRRHGGQYAGVAGYTASKQLLATDGGKLVYFAGSTAGQYFVLPAALELSLGGGSRFKTSRLFLSPCCGRVGIFYVGGEQLTTISIPPGGEAVFTRANVSAWYVTGSATLSRISSFASLKSASGWEQLPSGIIRQWGTAANGEMANGTMIVLPTTYPNEHFVTVACAVNTTGEIESAYTGDLTQNAFRLFTQSQAWAGGAWNNSVVSARFISIGW